MRLPHAALLAGSLALVACGGDPAAPEEPDEFDPVPFQTGVGHILTGTQTAPLAIFNEGSDEISDYFGGIVMIASRGGARPAAPGFSASSAAFPEFLKGRTYEWDVAEDEYDETLAPGPVTGARFLVYELNGAAFAEPLVDAGHIDVLDVGDGPARSVQMLAEIGGDAQADITASATGTLQDGSLVLDGFFGTGSARVEFEIDALNTVTAGGSASTYTGAFTVPANDLTVGVETEVDRGPVVTYGTHVSVTVPEGTVVLDGDSDGETFTGVVQVDGALYANLVVEGAAEPVVTGAGDVVLTAAEQQLFADLFTLLSSPIGFLDGLLPPFVFPLELEPGDA